MGAWIETSEYAQILDQPEVVAPRVGAWIETPAIVDMWKEIDEASSHPVWVRGLKQ